MKPTKKQRSLAAKRGWKTRLHNQRSAAAKRGWKTRRRKKRQITPAPPTLPRMEFLVVIEYRKKTRAFLADLYIVADKDATPTELADQSRSQLPEGKSFLANWIEGRAEITQGKLTSAPKQTRIRSFKRYKK